MSEKYELGCKGTDLTVDYQALLKMLIESYLTTFALTQ